MFKKTFAALLIVLTFSIFSFAQKSANNLTKWEFLEISGIRYGGQSGFNSRSYNFLTSTIYFQGSDSLEWMRESGWELVSVINNGDNPVSLYFKRPLNKTRTENEIALLKKDYETISQTPPKSVLVDLDNQEAKQKLDDFNKSEEIKLRTALKQIKNLSLEIISVQSKAVNLTTPTVGAEIVLNATSVLLKNKFDYRSSEAEKYYQDASRQIIENAGISTENLLRGYGKDISQGFKVMPIGKFDNFSGITLKISVVIDVNNQRNIVAQGFINGKWSAEK